MGLRNKLTTFKKGHSGLELSTQLIWQGSGFAAFAVDQFPIDDALSRKRAV
jgi:hypothetical protein